MIGFELLVFPGKSSTWPLGRIHKHRNKCDAANIYGLEMMTATEFVIEEEKRVESGVV
jgi:hypothetical protein